MFNKDKKTFCKISNIQTQKVVLGLATFAFLNITPLSASALSASADTGTYYPGIGYGATVLDLVLGSWENPDLSATGTTSIIVRIAKDGRPFSCETRLSSSSKTTDDSFCATIAKIGTFPEPPSRQNSEIFLTFVHGKKVKESVVNENPTLSNAVDSSLSQGPAVSSSPSAEPITLPADTSSSPEVLDPVFTETVSTTSEENTLEALKSAPPQSIFAQNSSAQTTSTQSASSQALINSAYPTSSPSSVHSASSIAADTANAVSSVGSTFLNDTNALNAQGAPNIAPSSQVSPLTDNTSPQNELPQTPVAQAKTTNENSPADSLVASENQVQEYSERIFADARSKLRIPMLPAGTYTSIIRLDIDPNGKLLDASLLQSSGNAGMDNEILSVMKEKITYPPTPNKKLQSLWLTFTVKI